MTPKQIFDRFDAWSKTRVGTEAKIDYFNTTVKEIIRERDFDFLEKRDDKLVLGQTATASITIGDATLSSISINTSNLLAGMPIVGTGIPDNTTISSITDSATLEMSQVAAAETVYVTGDLVSGSTAVTGILPNTNDLVASMTVTGVGIAAGTTISSVDSATQITLSAAATAAGEDASLACTTPSSMTAVNVSFSGKKHPLSTIRDVDGNYVNVKRVLYIEDPEEDKIEDWTVKGETIYFDEDPGAVTLKLHTIRYHTELTLATYTGLIATPATTIYSILIPSYYHDLILLGMKRQAQLELSGSVDEGIQADYNSWLRGLMSDHTGARIREASQREIFNYVELEDGRKIEKF